MTTEAQALAIIRAALVAGLIDDTIADKRHILRELADATLASGIVSGSTGNAGGGGTGGFTTDDVIRLQDGIERIFQNSIPVARNVERVVAIPQTTLTIPAGTVGSYFIQYEVPHLTICINSVGLVHYTLNGSEPTTSDCWFIGGSKEIWDSYIPAGETLKLLATSDATISIQPRMRYSYSLQ